jgi:cyclophilin family peptidyl-prolyl cis-trans isomerase
MIQGSGSNGWETSGESHLRPHIRGRIQYLAQHTGDGVVSMANSGSRTNGSPFFITSASTLRLNGRRTSSLWTSLNEIDAVNRGTELEDGSGGEVDQRCSDSEGLGVPRRLETNPFLADVISRLCILQTAFSKLRLRES